MQQPESAQEANRPLEHSSVSPGELLMRRVPNQPIYFKKGRLQQGTFLPRKHPNDQDGLSLSRRHTPERPNFLTPEQFRANCTDDKMRKTAGVLVVPVDDIWAIVGRLVKPAPTEADLEKGLVEDPGHVIIPEINSKLDHNGPDSTDASRGKLREMAAALAYRFSDMKHFAILPG